MGVPLPWPSSWRWRPLYQLQPTVTDTQNGDPRTEGFGQANAILAMTNLHTLDDVDVAESLLGQGFSVANASRLPTRKGFEVYG